MKDLINYILEKKKSFEFTNDERNSLIELIGYASEQLGEDSDCKQYEELRKNCYEDEMNSMIDLYELLDDKQTYPKITNRILQQNELNILIKTIQYALDKDLIDLSNILEKIQ